ncbi:MAG: C39 family peptidase [Chloroflexi bacterium]|nr:C39 family peptidase [Chloroflexota bacterium]
MQPLLTRRAFLSAACALAGLAAPSLAWAAASPPSVPARSAPTGAPDSWYIPDNAQAHDFRQQWNLSCEVASFKIVLIHYNLATVTEELLQDLLGYDENPNKGFRGDYRALSTHGLTNYGAHAPAVAKLIARFPRAGVFNPVPLANLDEVRAALSRNWLVMTWIPVALEPSRSVALEMSDGSWVSLVPGEHVIVLHGYDAGGFFTYDPRPTPRVPGYVSAAALDKGMSLFDVPALAVQPLF